MPAKVEVESGSGTAVVKATRTLTLESMKEATRAVWAAPGFARRSIMLDVREATFSLHAGEVQQLADFSKSGSTLEPPARMAFVVSSDSEFGQLRMFEVFRDQPGIEVEVFRDYALAQKWLAGEQ